MPTNTPAPWARTDRLALHRWAPEHLDPLRELAVLPEVVRHVGDGRPWDDATSLAKHEATLEHWRRHGFGWLAALDARGEFVGLVALTRRSAEESGIGLPAVELGYWIVPAAWGRGYATEAARAATDAVFARGAADRLVARHLAANTASVRLLAKLSFSRHHEVDGLVYSVLERPDR